MSYKGIIYIISILKRFYYDLLNSIFILGLTSLTLQSRKVVHFFLLTLYNRGNPKLKYSLAEAYSRSKIAVLKTELQLTLVLVSWSGRYWRLQSILYLCFCLPTATTSVLEVQKNLWSVRNIVVSFFALGCFFLSKSQPDQYQKQSFWW